MARVLLTSIVSPQHLVILNLKLTPTAPIPLPVWFYPVTLLYGTTASGGNSGNGTVFSLSFAPRLTIFPSGTNIVLTWPTNFAGFDYSGFVLQSAPEAGGTFTNIPGATTPYTNPIAGAQQFYRLSSLSAVLDFSFGSK